MKSLKRNLVKSAVEYQPDAIELANQPLPWWGRYGLLWVALFFGAVMIWACFSEMDVIVEGMGKVIPAEPTITMKPLQTTVIEDIKVKIGDRVKAGQQLITFDPRLANADESRLLHDEIVYTTQRDRLRCEFENRPYSSPRVDIATVVRQMALNKQRNEYFTERMKYFEGSLKRIDATIFATTANLKKLEKQLETLNRIVKMYADLREKGATSLKEYLSVQIQQLQSEADTERTRNSLQEYEQSKQALLAERNAFVQEWRKSISEELIVAEKNLSDTQQMLQKARMQSSYIDLRSPAEAMVHEIAAFSKGSAVREAEPLISLIPLNGEMLIEAEIPTKDIGKVKIGDSARIKLTAYPFQKHGTLDGTIVSLSEDSFVRQGAGGEIDGKVRPSSYYRALVKVSGKLINAGDDFRLIPGMEAMVEVKVAKRRVIEYLIYPLIKSLDEAGREP